jgi:hypothetical protein
MMATKRAAVLKTFLKDYHNSGRVSFKGAGRSARYRGAVTSMLKAGGTAAQSHRAGRRADAAQSDSP